MRQATSLPPTIADDLAYAFVIKNSRHTRSVDEDSDAAARDQGFRMINSEPIATDELDCKAAEWPSSLIALQSAFESLRSHVRILAEQVHLAACSWPPEMLR